ncbi:putative disease resistance RPP13-like protein 1, partial [Prunus dulcis]|uniref:putative disease resistance RPP13-like protein 1 n=1 Tax=Prunus dulcis TaxID=3755 RepID=UPI001481E9DE
MKLQSPFLDGAVGSKIIVSTRDAEVSKMMGAGTLVHNLEPMSNDVCFEVFEQHAFRNVNRDISPNFGLLKEKIVARCSGLPLAARTLGGLLLRKEMNEWEEILNKKLWSLSNERDILPWAAGDICFRLEDKQNSDHVQLGCFTKARHASYISGKYDVVKRFEAFSEVKQLRTFLPLSSDYPSNYLSRKVTFDLLPKLQYLRVLSLNGYLLTELPNSIGKLKYLRYLDLSYTRIACLPKSTTSLYNLQTLILEGCRYLEALPLNLRNLVNLRHLNNSDVDSLKAMPPQLGRLTNLQSLPNFVVGKGSDQSDIREIGSLFHLQRTLRLLRLENVIDAEDARRANLKFKERLDELVLEWSDNAQETQLGVLDKLETDRMLKILGIKGYAGLKFSQWIGDRLFSTMVRVSLNKCENCKILPPLGQLPSLKTLSIRGMTAVENVGPEFYGESSLPFPVLEELQLANMHNWKKWLPFVQDQ